MIIPLVLGFIFGANAQDCRTVVELWQAMGKTTFVDPTSAIKCCSSPQLYVMCKTNKDGTFVEPVKIISL